MSFNGNLRVRAKDGGHWEHGVWRSIFTLPRPEGCPSSSGGFPEGLRQGRVKEKEREGLLCYILYPSAAPRPKVASHFVGAKAATLVCNAVLHQPRQQMSMPDLPSEAIAASPSTPCWTLYVLLSEPIEVLPNPRGQRSSCLSFSLDTAPCMVNKTDATQVEFTLG